MSMRINTYVYYYLTIFILISVVAFQIIHVSHDRSDDVVLLTVPTSTSITPRQIAYDGCLYVIIANSGQDKLRIWNDKCSWGYHNISIEIKCGNGDKTVLFKKKGRDWSRNFPIFEELMPHESISFTIKLSEHIWDGLSLLKDYEGQTIKMRIIYEVFKDNQSVNNRVWIGRLESPYLDYFVASAVR